MMLGDKPQAYYTSWHQMLARIVSQVHRLSQAIFQKFTNEKENHGQSRLQGTT